MLVGKFHGQLWKIVYLIKCSLPVTCPQNPGIGKGDGGCAPDKMAQHSTLTAVIAAGSGGPRSYKKSIHRKEADIGFYYWGIIRQ